MLKDSYDSNCTKYRAILVSWACSGKGNEGVEIFKIVFSHITGSHTKVKARKPIGGQRGTAVCCYQGSKLTKTLIVTSPKQSWVYGLSSLYRMSVRK